MFTVYILQSLKDNKYYIGYTSNLEARLSDHFNGKTKSLKGRLPVNLVYTEVFSTKSDAIKREKQIKAYKGGDAFKKLLK